MAALVDMREVPPCGVGSADPLAGWYRARGVVVPCPLGTALQKQLEGKLHHNGRMGLGLLA